MSKWSRNQIFPVLYWDNNDVGVKRCFDPMIPTNCSALRAPAILKHLKSAHFSSKNGYFSVFCAPQGHTCLRKRSPHDLLTLVSYYNKCIICVLHMSKDSWKNNCMGTAIFWHLLREKITLTRQRHTRPCQVRVIFQPFLFRFFSGSGVFV